MADAAESALDEALEEDPLAAASSAVAAARIAYDAEDGRRLSAGIQALRGSDRALAATADPSLLICRTAIEAQSHLAQLGNAARSHDYLCAAVTLAWSGDTAGSYTLLRAAHDRAITEGRVAFAVGILERLAHHALIFGDVALARETLAEALASATLPRLRRWRLRCSAAAARLAVDSGDAETALDLARRARAERPPAPLLALFAPAVLRTTAGTGGDDAAAFADDELLDLALHCDAPEAAAAATAASLIAASAPVDAASTQAAAVRRSLLAIENAAAAPELFSLSARYAPAADAQFAVAALRAVLGPSRRYIEAHLLLSRAYAEFRFGERLAAVDSASDAARAFDALGLRYWTNEAMLVLVHRDRTADAPARRRPSALSLTEREQQVAHLVRRGASNREVANTLQISEHTVERHVSSILSRLGLRSRWQIVDARKVEGQH